MSTTATMSHSQYISSIYAYSCSGCGSSSPLQPSHKPHLQHAVMLLGPPPSPQVALGAAPTALTGASDRLFALYVAPVCEAGCGPLRRYVLVPPGMQARGEVGVPRRHRLQYLASQSHRLQYLASHPACFLCSVDRSAVTPPLYSLLHAVYTSPLTPGALP